MLESENGKTYASRSEFKNTVELQKRGPSRNIDKLATQVYLLNKRLTNLEESFLIVTSGARDNISTDR